MIVFRYFVFPSAKVKKIYKPVMSVLLQKFELWSGVPSLTNCTRAFLFEILCLTHWLHSHYRSSKATLKRQFDPMRKISTISGPDPKKLGFIMSYIKHKARA